MIGGGGVFIHGAGEMGKHILFYLKKNNIPVAGFMVDSKFFTENKFVENIPVFCADNYFNTDEKITVVAGFQPYKNIAFENNINVTLIDCGWSGFPIEDDFVYGDNLYAEYFRVHRSEFESVYWMLEDEKSRSVMDGFINNRISGKRHYVSSLVELPQYFVNDIVRLHNVMGYVDCGAYDGDTYINFCKEYEKQTGREYTGKAWLFEPSFQNIKLLEQKDFGDNCNIIKKGTWDKTETLIFMEKEQGVASKILCNASKYGRFSLLEVDVVTIDNLIDERVDFIKMDIEGSELKSLVGASETISKNHPILAICVYHRKNDLLDIPNFIKQMYAGYKLYLRLHTYYGDDLVLYAIP